MRYNIIMKVHAISFRSTKMQPADLHPFMYTPEIKDYSKNKKDIKIMTALCALAAVSITLLKLFKK